MDLCAVRCSELDFMYCAASSCGLQQNAFGVRTHAAMASAVSGGGLTEHSSAAAWNSSLQGCCAQASHWKLMLIGFDT